MCGRYSLYAPSTEIMRTFSVSPEDAQSLVNAGPRYNIAPTSQVAVVRQPEGSRDRELAYVRWGLIPRWAKEAGKGPLLINARAETVTEKPSFRSAFSNRRCLVIADGFFEWQKLPDRKQPYYFQVDGGSLFAFAGIWDWWVGHEVEPIDSCAIITTGANTLSALVHDRMPVILSPEAWDAWLSQDEYNRTQKTMLQSLLRPFPVDRMTVLPVSTVVNSTRHDLKDCVEPIGPPLTV